MKYILIDTDKRNLKGKILLKGIPKIIGMRLPNIAILVEESVSI